MSAKKHFLNKISTKMHFFTQKLANIKNCLIYLPTIRENEKFNQKLNLREYFYEKKIDAVNDLPIYRYWSGKRAGF
jgi:hypothetical protein